MALKPKNWADFQHYKKRSPPWIKLHRGLLDDYDFFRLPVASRALAPCLWLLASEHADGLITASFDAIAFRLRMSVDELEGALKPLVDAGFFIALADRPHDASKVLARREQTACLETEEETEVEVEKRLSRVRYQGSTMTKGGQIVAQEDNPFLDASDGCDDG